MNYLLNIYLTPYLENKEKIVGNVIAEFIKYSRRVKYNSGVEEGISIHNRLCDFMKNNEAFNRSKSRVNPKYTRYSNDIVKLYYSHFMAAHWDTLTESTLENSVKNTYLILLESFDIVPSKLKKMLPALLSSPGLGSMKTVGGLHHFIGELSRKGFCVGYLQNTMEDLLVNYAVFKEDFDIFIEDLKEFGHKLKAEEESFALANAS